MDAHTPNQENLCPEFLKGVWWMKDMGGGRGGMGVDDLGGRSNHQRNKRNQKDTKLGDETEGNNNGNINGYQR